MSESGELHIPDLILPQMEPLFACQYGISLHRPKFMLALITLSKVVPWLLLIRLVRYVDVVSLPENRPQVLVIHDGELLRRLLQLERPHFSFVDAEQKRFASLISMIGDVLILLPGARCEAAEDVMSSCYCNQYGILLSTAGFMEGSGFESVFWGAIGEGDIGDSLAGPLNDVGEEKGGELLCFFCVFEGRSACKCGHVHPFGCLAFILAKVLSFLTVVDASAHFYRN